MSPQEVCSNATLQAMARLLPTTVEAFRSLPGMTAEQADKFYSKFSPILASLKAAGTVSGCSASVAKSASTRRPAVVRKTGPSSSGTRRKSAASSSSSLVRSMPL